jgi:hypothetical protein
MDGRVYRPLLGPNTSSARVSDDLNFAPTGELCAEVCRGVEILNRSAGSVARVSSQCRIKRNQDPK